MMKEKREGENGIEDKRRDREMESKRVREGERQRLKNRE